MFWIYMNSPAVDVSKWSFSHPWQQNNIPSLGWRNFYLPLRTILIDWLFCFPFCVWILVFLPLNYSTLNYSLMESSCCCCDLYSEWQAQGCTQVVKTSRQNPTFSKINVIHLCKAAICLNPIFTENAANWGLHTCNFPSYGVWVGCWGVRWGCPDGPLISTRCWHLRKRLRRNEII